MNQIDRDMAGPRQAETNPRVFGRAVVPSVQEIDFVDLMRTIWRRKAILFACVLTITICAAIVTAQLTPRYAATAQIMIDPRQRNTVDIEAVMSGLTVDAAAVESEVQILTSRSLATRLVERLGLDQYPEFNAALHEPSMIADLRSTIAGLIPTWLSGQTDELEGLSPEELRQLELAGYVNTVLDRLDASPVRRSYVIAVSFESESPQRAAEIANTIGELYIVDQLEAKYEATRQVTDWLSDRLASLRAQVEASERAVGAYREQENIVATKDTTIVGQQLAELNSQLIIARTERASAEAQLQQLRRMVNDSGGVESAADVLNSPLIQRLREQEAEVQRRRAELETRYGERHPTMINVTAEIADLRDKIRIEVAKILGSMENEVQIARTKEATLASNLRRLEDQQNDLGRAEVKLRELEREALANRTIYESFLARFKETSEQESIQQPDARIISYADVPGDPSYPKTRLFVAMAFVGSVLLGIVLIFLVERLDNGFRTPQQIEDQAGVAVIGMVPFLTDVKRRDHDVEHYPIENLTSSYTEALRNVRSGLLLSNVDEPPKVVMVTSSIPGEGKTVLAVSLARVAAASGQRVLLIECDFRRPRIEKIFAQHAKEGLLAALEEGGDHGAQTLIDEQTGLYIIPALRQVPSPADVLGSKNMRDLLERLRKRYDLIVLDTPPVLAVTDARVLSPFVDKTIYAVRWEKTPREVVLTGIRQLRDDHASIAGVVLTQVNLRKHMRYGYGDHGYYYGRYREYYS